MGLLLASVATLSDSKSKERTSEDRPVSDEEPTDWPMEDYYGQPGCRQSPIDINYDNVTVKTLEPLRFRSHNDPNTNLNMISSKESVRMNLNEYTKAPLIRGGPLLTDYLFYDFHIHWGENNSIGSEHTINGKRYTVEYHVVYYNSAYNDFKDASNKPRGLAVVAFFGKVGSGSPSPIKHLMRAASYVKDADSCTVLDAPAALGSWSNFLMEQGHYITYPGSLTTHPFSETVTFIVFNCPVTIRSTHMERLRRTTDETGNQILNNWRELQPVLNRPIIFTKN